MIAASTSFKHMPPPPTSPSATLLSKVQNSSFNIPPVANMAPPSREEVQCENLDSVMKIDDSMAGKGSAKNLSPQIAPPEPARDEQCENKDSTTVRVGLNCRR